MGDDSGGAEGVGSLGAFKRRSRAGFLSSYAGFRCLGGCGICP